MYCRCTANRQVEVEIAKGVGATIKYKAVGELQSNGGLGWRGGLDEPACARDPQDVWMYLSTMWPRCLVATCWIPHLTDVLRICVPACRQA